MRKNSPRALRIVGVSLVLAAMTLPAGMAGAERADNFGTAVVDPGALSAPTAPVFKPGKRGVAQEARILVMEEFPGNDRRYYDDALDNLGFGRTLVTDWTELEGQLVNEGPWDLVIANSYGNNPGQTMLTALLVYLNAGGRLIYSQWGVDSYSGDPLLTAMGVTFVSAFTTPLAFSPTAGNASHPVFTVPNAVSSFTPTDNQADIDGQIVTVTGGAVALAAFAGNPTSGAIVWGPQRRSIFNAFQSSNFAADVNQNGKPDMVELIENQITLIPLLTVPDLAPPPPAGQSLAFTAEVLNGPGASLQLFFRRGGQGGGSYQSVPMGSVDGTVFTGLVPGAQMTVRGLEYYVVATRNGAVVTYPTLDAVARPQALRLALNNQKGPALPDARYRIIGFPFEVDPAAPGNVFVDDLGAPDNRRWRVGRFDSAAEAVVEFPDFGDVRQGHGYWAIARGNRAVGASGLSALPDTTIGGTRFAILELEPGWNQIATPFAFAIAWGGRILDPAGGIDDAVWDFVGGDPLYEVADVLQPFRGYWIENTAEDVRLLMLPYLEAVVPSLAAKTPIRGEQTADWRLALELKAGALSDRSLVLGAAPEAGEGRDALDYGQPPAPPERFVALASLLPASGHAAAVLAGDFRPAGAEGWRFRLRASGDVNEPAVLSIGAATELPSHLAVALIDLETGRAHDLLAGGRLVLPRLLTAPGEEYELLVGETDWVWSDGRAPAVLPANVALAQNHPNPFNPQTTISFALPAPGRVNLQIFDLAGRQVATLVDDVLASGPHAVTWNGRDQAGRPASSGTYYYRLLAGGEVLTRSMLLLK